ncbi:hypothetical protein [Candidatus Albibeggiatoa sp. nov. NOAA]|uniref:hypothetical protein n=1 Tax=Candidatus Albibeggiatoa sp. nov. NOAA TaxID=3162724 RepID=UPI0032FD2A4D|nr:hypothetical protein [Thiotrichaceae bacterium]
MIKQNQKMKITDPYLKERVRLSGEKRSGGGWFIWLLLLAGLGGGGYYFYPQLKPHVQPLVAEVQQQIEALTKSESSAEPVKVASNTGAAAENTDIQTEPAISQPESKPIEPVIDETVATPKEQVDASNTETIATTSNTAPPTQEAIPTVVKPEPIVETVARPEVEKTVKPVEKKPVEAVAQPESANTVKAPAPEQEAKPEKTPLSEVAVTTALPHEMPADTKQPVAAKPEVIESKPELTPQQQAQVKRLVSKAKVQLRRLRLTRPEGDNAYATYQALQKLDQEKANEVLTSIVDWYQAEAQKNLKEGWIAYPKNRNAMIVYQRLQKLAPEHEGTKNLLKEILLALKARVDIHLERDNITKPKNDNAYVNARLMYNTAPQHEITQASLADVEKRMLEIADRQIARKKFTTPEDDSAYQTYKIMLRMNPESENAKQAIVALATRYYDLAKKRQRQGRITAAKSLVERGLSIDPEHERLNALQQVLGD